MRRVILIGRMWMRNGFASMCTLIGIIAQILRKLITYCLSRKKGGRGVESGMGSREVRHNRYINDDDGKSCWDWLSYRATEIDKKKLLGCCIEIDTRFFFSNFVYTFGGENYV